MATTTNNPNPSTTKTPNPNTPAQNPAGDRPGQTSGNAPQQPMEFPNQPLQPSRNNPVATPPGMRPEGERKGQPTDDQSGCCTPDASKGSEARRTPPGGPERQDIEAD